MSKTAILIGYGGMGKRYFQALKKLKFKVIAICDKKINLFSSELPNNILLVKNFYELINFDADLLCVASNTKSRLDILDRFCNNGKIKRIITEKPLLLLIKLLENSKNSKKK